MYTPHGESFSDAAARAEARRSVCISVCSATASSLRVNADSYRGMVTAVIMLISTMERITSRSVNPCIGALYPIYPGKDIIVTSQVTIMCARDF